MTDGFVQSRWRRIIAAASKKFHRLRFRWLFITYLHLTIDCSYFSSLNFSLFSLPDVYCVGLVRVAFFFHKNSYFKAKDALLFGFFFRLLFLVFRFELIGFLRQHIAITFCVCVARWCVTVLLFLLSCYAGVNLIYVPHAIRCYTTGVFCYLFLFCLFFGRDCYRSNKWWLCIPLLDSQSIGTSDRPSRISFSITKSFIHSSSSR